MFNRLTKLYSCYDKSYRLIQWFSDLVSNYINASYCRANTTFVIFVTIDTIFLWRDGWLSILPIQQLLFSMHLWSFLALEDFSVSIICIWRSVDCFGNLNMGEIEKSDWLENSWKKWHGRCEHFVHLRANIAYVRLIIIIYCLARHLASARECFYGGYSFGYSVRHCKAIPICQLETISAPCFLWKHYGPIKSANDSTPSVQMYRIRARNTRFPERFP